MSFRKTVLVLVFFSPSIAVFRILCPYPKLPFCEKEKDPIFSEQSLGSCEKSSIFLSPHLNHSEISVATTARDRGDKYWVGMERNEWLLLGYKRITQVLKCPPVPTQTKGGLCLIFLGVTRVKFPSTMRFLSIKFSLWIKIMFSNWDINKSTDFWIHMLWQMRSILMALALSGQMGLICRIVGSRYKKKIVGDKDLWIPCSRWWNAWLLLLKI